MISALELVAMWLGALALVWVKIARWHQRRREARDLEFFQAEIRRLNGILYPTPGQLAQLFTARLEVWKRLGRPRGDPMPDYHWYGTAADAIIWDEDDALPIWKQARKLPPHRIQPGRYGRWVIGADGIPRCPGCPDCERQRRPAELDDPDRR